MFLSPYYTAVQHEAMKLEEGDNKDIKFAIFALWDNAARISQRIIQNLLIVYFISQVSDS